MKLIKNSRPISDIVFNEDGKIGYVIAWLMGVPASVLLLIFLVRGH